ncbi:N-sulfoglucosamine sulfohydrolase [Planctomycetales bacterium 10988]|nr:N-sulfoglucosamine sulfohydrolase [Planctomycetales bacterium 10988]
MKTTFRIHLQLLTACFASLSMLSGLQAEDKRPNVLFAFADDLGRYASIYATAEDPSLNDCLETPNFDRVAREGTLYTNAFVSAPSCTPSRAAILSGRHFFRNGSHSQLHHPWLDGHPDPWSEVRGFPLQMQDNGYHIGWTYKLHLYEDRMGGKSQNYSNAGKRFNSFSEFATKEKKPKQSKKQLLEEVRANFQDFLEDRDPDQPFYYWFNPTNTHRPWARGSGKKLWGIDPDSLEGLLPDFLPDNEIVREDFADYLGEAMAFDAALGVLLEELEQRGELDNTLFAISGDHGAPGFPRGKCNLYDFGTRVPLAIRYPGQVAAGRVIHSPVSLIDLAPTFLEVAGLQSIQQMDGESLMPAMRLKTKKPESKLRGWALTGRETHVRDARPGGLPYPMRAIRTADYLYIVNFKPDRWPVAEPPLAAPIVHGMRTRRTGEIYRPTDLDQGPTHDYFFAEEGTSELEQAWQLGIAQRPAEELYAVKSDPDQMNNLADSPEHQPIRKQLRRKLMKELREGNDPRVMQKDSPFDHPPYILGDPLQGVVDQSATQEPK